MKLLIQRVKNAQVSIDHKIVGKIDHGILAFLGITHTDTEKNCDFLVKKLTELRIFQDQEGKMNLSLLQTEGEVLVISQFTLYGACLKGRRPSFTDSAPPEIAVPLYESFIQKLNEVIPGKVQTGKFGAMMDIELINHGPVTFLIEK